MLSQSGKANSPRGHTLSKPYFGLKTTRQTVEETDNVKNVFWFWTSPDLVDTKNWRV